jgi:streptomycin 6-kinase
VNVPDPLPDALARNNRLSFPAAADAWLASLPARVAALAGRFGLAEVGPPFPGLSYNYVAPAVRAADGAPVVLKVGVPREEIATEIAALRFWGGDGAVRLLDAAPEEGALLLERLEPGTELVTLRDDDAATRAAALVMRRLWRPVPDDAPSFPHASAWAADLAGLRPHYGGGTGPFPTALVDRAEGLFRDLFASEGSRVLLHGDLHHYNVLAGRGEWLAIDPKGVTGEPAYEAGALLRNPLDVSEWPDLARVTARRLDILAETLDLDRERLRRWALAQAVLSAWWSAEGNPDETAAYGGIAVAETLERA